MTAAAAVLVGAMCGTSLDGVTAAVARFHGTAADHHVELLGVTTIPYLDADRERLAAAMDRATAAEYLALSARVGTCVGEAVVQVLAQAGVARRDVRAVAMHGQTLWHAPPVGSWQLGDAARVVERTGLPVITDLRARDIAAGGQGAPLVPIADAMLFGAATGARALQNIGGMANLTVVPRRGSLAGVRAFDTGPGVAVIDTLVQALTGERFDRDGQYAAMGTPLMSVVNARLAEAFFHAPPPRSTGREHFGAAYAMALLDACRAADPTCLDADVIATATELTARSIALAYERFVPEPLADVLVSGGGAHNVTLIERLRTLLAPMTMLRRFDDEFFVGDAKEAVAFAYLGWLHLQGQPGNVPSATGAVGPRMLGALYPA